MQDGDVITRKELLRIVRRLNRATRGPYSLLPTSGNFRRLITGCRAAHDIGLIYDSVAENGEFLEHSWEDVFLLMKSTVFLKAWARGFFESIRKCPTVTLEGGESVYQVGVTERFLNECESRLSL